MSYVLVGFLIIVVFVFGYCVWIVRDMWRWYHLTLASLILILLIILPFPTAGIFKSRSEWHRVKEDLEAQLARLEKEQETLKYGDPTTGEGVLALQARLHKHSLEAGRRWQNLRVRGDASEQNITLVRPQPEAEVAPGMEDQAPQDDQPPPDDTPLVPEGLIVYGFAESRIDDYDFRVPTFYLGEFRVQSSTPTEVVLQATAPLEPPQNRAITSGEARNWSLYELLPLDGHQTFVAEGSEPTDQWLFGRVDEDRLRELMGRVREETLDEYLRDGSRALPDDPPESRWVRVEFTQAHTITVDSPEQRGALDGDFFDGSGQAVDSRLQRGEDDELRFRSGDQIVVLEEQANLLIDQGIVTLVDTYYVRPLNDYRMVLRRIRHRLNAVNNRIEQLEFEEQVLQDAIAATDKMLVANQDSKLKLEKDVAQLQAESQAIETYNAQVQETLTSSRQRLRSLYLDNQRLHTELVEVHADIQQSLISPENESR